MRARSYRGTHGLVVMVRRQVALMMDSMGKVAKATDALRVDVNNLHVHVAELGGMMNTLAESVDDHEARLTRLEKKRGKP